MKKGDTRYTTVKDEWTDKERFCNSLRIMLNNKSNQSFIAGAIQMAFDCDIISAREYRLLNQFNRGW